MINTDKLTHQEKAFYKESIELLKESGIDFLLGGAFAFFYYTGMSRFTKDLDLFCIPARAEEIRDIGYLFLPGDIEKSG